MSRFFTLGSILIHGVVLTIVFVAQIIAVGPLPTACELTVNPASIAAAATGPTIGNSGTIASGIFGTITAAMTLTSP